VLGARRRRRALLRLGKFSTTRIRHRLAQPRAVLAHPVAVIEPAVLGLLVPRVRRSPDARPRAIAALVAAVALPAVARAAHVEQLPALAAPRLSEDQFLRHLAAAQKV
jgi:hypothetical protein